MQWHLLSFGLKGRLIKTAFSKTVSTIFVASNPLVVNLVKNYLFNYKPYLAFIVAYETEFKDCRGPPFFLVNGLLQTFMS